MNNRWLVLVLVNQTRLQVKNVEILQRCLCLVEVSKIIWFFIRANWFSSIKRSPLPEIPSKDSSFRNYHQKVNISPENSIPSIFFIKTNGGNIVFAHSPRSDWDPLTSQSQRQVDIGSIHGPIKYQPHRLHSERTDKHGAKSETYPFSFQKSNR